MGTIFTYKIDLKKSKIPKHLKLPKYVYPQFSENEKPNLFLNTKMDLKKTEFLFEVVKDNLGYSFKRIDPFPIIWSNSNILTLYKNKDKPQLFQIDEKDHFFLSTQPYNVSRLTYDENDRSFSNHTAHYAGKKKDKLKLYDETFVYFDFVTEKKADVIFDVLPSVIKKKLNKENLKKSFKLLTKKATKSKKFFSRRAFNYQNIFSTYDKYNLEILAKKLQELKFYVLPGQDSYSDKKHFFMFLEVYTMLAKKIYKTDDTVKILTEITSYLSFDKNNKKNSENLIFYMDLITDYVENNKK